MDKRLSIPSLSLGLVIGIALTSAWFFGGVKIQTADEPVLNQISTSAPFQSSTSGAVAVNNQSAGDSVLVESVTVPPTGVWVAVREIRTNHSLGNVLGAARASSPHSNLIVPLLRATAPNRTYAIELYRDGGSDQFDLSKDSVYVDFDTGSRVIVYFKTIK